MSRRVGPMWTWRFGMPTPTVCRRTREVQVDMRRWLVLGAACAVVLSGASVAWACVPTGGKQTSPTTTAVPSGDAARTRVAPEAASQDGAPSGESAPDQGRAMGIVLLVAGVAGVAIGAGALRWRRRVSPSAPVLQETSQP